MTVRAGAGRHVMLLAAVLGACGRGEQPQAADRGGLVADGGAPAAEDVVADVAPAAQLAELQRGSPEDVVRLLLQWDTAGLRFDGPYADALAGLYCFQPEQGCVSDEPAWDFAVVVDGYTLDPVVVSADSAQYVATFDEVGAVWPDRLADPIGTPPETLSLRRMDGLWRIVGLGSQMPPHLSRNGVLRTYRGVEPDSAVVARWLEDRDRQ